MEFLFKSRFEVFENHFRNEKSKNMQEDTKKKVVDDNITIHYCCSKYSNHNGNIHEIRMYYILLKIVDWSMIKILKEK